MPYADRTTVPVERTGALLLCIKAKLESVAGKGTKS
jgi:hypothetical protein